MNRQWAFTPPGADYPPYFNVTELDDGAIQIAVRGPKKPDGSCGDAVAMQMSVEDFRPLARQIAAEV